MSIDAYWSLEPVELFDRLRSGPAGLTSAQAEERLREHGPNEIHEERRLSRLGVLWSQARNPLLLLLLFAAALSTAAGESIDAVIVLTIVVATVSIASRREYAAHAAAAAMRSRLKTRATVLRDGRPKQAPIEEVVPGDVAHLSGCLVPADGVVLEASDCHISEAVLTGEIPPGLLLAVAAVTATHLASAELMKRWFYRGAA